MRRADAPPAGWYPDPEGSARLRWWDGEDWRERWRSRPPVSNSSAASSGIGLVQRAAEHLEQHGGRISRHEQEQLLAQVRSATRSEIDRAVATLGAQARHATEHIGPLVGQYTNRLISFLKRALLLLVVLAVAWFVFQAIAEVTFFQWLGDRIDNLFGSDALPLRTPPS